MTTAGRLLVATPELVSGVFHRSVILVCDHDAEGALGVILNHSSGEPVAEHLPDWDASAAAPAAIFVGGPVQPEVAVAVAVGRADFLIAVPGFESTVGLVDVAGAVPGDAAVRIFSGYASWAPGQLDAEIVDGTWWVVDAFVDDVHTNRPEGLWQRVVTRQKNEVALFSHYPERPGLN